ncbi:MAG: hypothetical protein HOV83_28710 [Catenulispora sp.]|nr:hypothetical protein [Catenulispora sp.]
MHGYCIGGGLEMFCASDIRYATGASSFAAGEIKWGWHGGSGATQFLTRIVGSGHASELLMTGERIDAAEAGRIGLTNRLYATKDELLAAAHAVAAKIAGHAPVPVEAVKKLVRVAQSTSIEVGLAYENDLFTYEMRTADAAEGRRTFAEKRAPVAEHAHHASLAVVQVVAVEHGRLVVQDQPDRLALPHAQAEGIAAGPAGRTHHGEGPRALALRLGGQREDAAGQRDQEVVTLAHADQRRVDGDRDAGEAVGVRHRKPVAAERQPERGVGGGVDHPKPYAPRRPGCPRASGRSTCRGQGVPERAARWRGRLGQAGRAVHRGGDADAVPVHGGRGGHDEHPAPDDAAPRPGRAFHVHSGSPLAGSCPEGERPDRDGRAPRSVQRSRPSPR